jgi:hypothetical protein
MEVLLLLALPRKAKLLPARMAIPPPVSPRKAKVQLTLLPNKVELLLARTEALLPQAPPRRERPLLDRRVLHLPA